MPLPVSLPLNGVARIPRMSRNAEGSVIVGSRRCGLPNIYLNRSMVSDRLIREPVLGIVNKLIAPRGLPGFGLLAAPSRAAATGTRMAVTRTVVVAGTAGSTALLGGSMAASMGRSLGRSAPDFPALTRAAAGLVIEALGGPPARRSSTNGLRRWIEVRGLSSEHASAIADTDAGPHGNPINLATGGVRRRASSRPSLTADTDKTRRSSQTGCVYWLVTGE